MKVEVKCLICEKIFLRLKGEFDRSVRLGRPSYCSRFCSGRAANRGRIYSSNAADHLRYITRRDEWTPFRRHLASARNRFKECILTLIDLKEQWDRQNGLCPYTGWQLLNLKTTGHKLAHTPNRASLDRKDSAKGYVRGNIQFVSMMAQYAKHEWGEDELLKFCKAVSDFRDCSMPVVPPDRL